MRERLDKLLGRAQQGVDFYFPQPLRQHIEEVSRPVSDTAKTSVLYDESDSNRALAKVLKQKGLDAGALKDHIRGYISEAKKKGFRPTNIMRASAAK
jgi:hypothetical protein